MVHQLERDTDHREDLDSHREGRLEDRLEDRLENQGRLDNPEGNHRSPCKKATVVPICLAMGFDQHQYRTHQEDQNQERQWRPRGAVPELV